MITKTKYCKVVQEELRNFYRQDKVIESIIMERIKDEPQISKLIMPIEPTNGPKKRL